MSPTGSSPRVRVQRIGNNVVLVLSAGLGVTKVLLCLGVWKPSGKSNPKHTAKLHRLLVSGGPQKTSYMFTSVSSFFLLFVMVPGTLEHSLTTWPIVNMEALFLGSALFATDGAGVQV